MSRNQPQEPRNGSRAAGYLVATLLGAPFLFLLMVPFLGIPASLGVALCVVGTGLAYALRAQGQDHEPRR